MADEVESVGVEMPSQFFHRIDNFGYRIAAHRLAALTMTGKIHRYHTPLPAQHRLHVSPVSTVTGESVDEQHHFAPHTCHSVGYLVPVREPQALQARIFDLGPGARCRSRLKN